MSENQMTGKDAVKRFLPVALALVLIVIIALVATSVKGCSNKTPKIEKSDDVYLTLGDLKVTNERLYTYMKQNYGVDELLRLVDNKIYASKIESVKSAASTIEEPSELDKYIMNSVFERELTKDDASGIKEANQEKWDDLISSLLMNNLIKSVKDDEKDVYDLSSPVWTVVREYYALQFARREVAKEAYKAELLKTREKDGKTGYFDEDTVKEYFENNYKNKVKGMFIPFTSEDAALKAMYAVGINTNSKVLGKDGWVKASFDFNTSGSDSIPSEEFLTPTEVLDKFIELYNLVYNYQDKTITSSDYTKVLDYTKTLSRISSSLQTAIEAIDKVTGDIVLPLEIKVDGEESVATIAWEVTDGTNLTLSEDGKTLVYTSPEVAEGEEDASVVVKITSTISYKDQNDVNHEAKATYELTVESTDAKDAEQVISIDDVTPFYLYDFNAEELEKRDIKVIWSDAELTEINSSLQTIMKADSTTYPLTDDASKFYKTYTIKPQKCGDYYFLCIKWGEVVQASGYDDETVKAEIEEKLLEEELTDNNISKMIYQARNDAKLTIFDRYLEAIYDYRYTYFYETTLKLTDYDKYTDSKKKEASVVARFKVDGKEVEISAQELFEELKNKYAVSTTVDLMNQYRVISSKFNTIYNPYTKEIMDNDSYRDLLQNEVGGFRKNFELNYFTYSYLSYYGFIPNFPAKYGWNNFKVDYFGAFSDEELLANSNFGGSVYSKALSDLTESLYTTAGSTTWEETDVYKKMKEAQDKWYGLNVVNLLVYVDNDFNSSADTQSDKHVTDEEANTYEFETTTWTDKQKELAPKLIELALKLADKTDKAGIYNQLTEIVENYKNAGYEKPLSEPTDTDTIYTYNYWAEFKACGLMVKVESAQDYNNSSSLVEEFLDELEVMYNEVKTAGYEGTFDVPYVSSRNCETTYGLHRIIALGITEVPELPSEKDVLIYNLVQKASNNANSTVAYKKAIYDEAVKELKEKYEIEYTSSYQIDSELESRINQWYTNAVSELSGTDVLTRQFIDYLKENRANIKSTDSEYNRILDIIIDISEKDLEKKEAEK